MTERSEMALKLKRRAELELVQLKTKRSYLDSGIKALQEEIEFYGTIASGLVVEEKLENCSHEWSKWTVWLRFPEDDELYRDSHCLKCLMKRRETSSDQKLLEKQKATIAAELVNGKIGEWT